MTLSINLENEDATVELGRKIGLAAKTACVIYLGGQLGAGKTTFCRGVLNAFGYSGAVKSPTYTLVEPYEIGLNRIYHFDLYRLGEPEELEFMGIRDYFQQSAICLIEWPTRGKGFLPDPDLTLDIAVEGQGRRAQIISGTRRGEQVLSLVQE